MYFQAFPVLSKLNIYQQVNCLQLYGLAPSMIAIDCYMIASNQIRGRCDAGENHETDGGCGQAGGAG